MSIDAALGRVDQILQFRQQLLDPQVLGSDTSGGASLAPNPAGPAPVSTDFATALATAQSGPLPVTSVQLPATQAPQSVQAMVDAANSLVGQPYVWGGGHSGWGPQNGYDCSGFVSAVLHAGGYLETPQDTQTLASAPGIESGPGQYVTIYDRTSAGSSTDHVIIDLNGQFYESGGERGSWGGGAGVQPIATPPQGYLSTFNLVLHPAGL